MRGSIWTVVALGVVAAMTPAILDVDVSGDATGQTALDLLSALDILIGLGFAVAVFGLLITLAFSDSGF
jgi:hypothetical protein